jgi:alcohol dehydrogenase class IV
MAAARRVLTSLPARLARPDDAGPRRALSLAALEAGLAFSQTRTALAHALSYALTLEQGVPHGAACAVWLPSVWKLAVGRDLGLDLALAELAALLHREESALEASAGRRPKEQPEERATEGAAALTRWLRRLGAAADPREVGVEDGAQRLLSALDSPRGRNFVASPAP